MKKTIVAALAAALMSSGAYAADVFGKGSTKDGAGFEGPVAVNWSGIYIGGALGYGNANHELTLQRYNAGTYCFDKDGTSVATAPLDPTRPSGGDTKPLNTDGTCDTDEVLVNPSTRDSASLDGLNTSGLVGDVRLGGDLQRGRFVFGVFGTYGFNDMTSSGNIGDDISFGIEKGDEWSLGARAGLLVNNRTLAYILAAYTQSEFEFGGRIGDESASKTVDFSGITVGGGVEFAVTNNIFLGVEGTHTFYGEETLWDSGTEEGCTVCRGKRLTDEIGETKVMGTLKIKLNTGLGGVID